MTRRKALKHAPADRLARMLLEAACAAYVAHRGARADRPGGWHEVSLVGRAGYREVAQHLLRRGVRLPLEDAPERVEWLASGRPVFELIDVFAPPVEE